MRPSSAGILSPRSFSRLKTVQVISHTILEEELRLLKKNIAPIKLNTTFQNRLKNWVSTGENGFHIIFLHEMNLRDIGNKGWGARDRPGGGMGVQAHCRASFKP